MPSCLLAYTLFILVIQLMRTIPRWRFAVHSRIVPTQRSSIAVCLEPITTRSITANNTLVFLQLNKRLLMQKKRELRSLVNQELDSLTSHQKNKPTTNDIVLSSSNGLSKTTSLSRSLINLRQRSFLAS